MATLPRHYFIGSVIFVMIIVGVMSLITEIQTGGVGTNEGISNFGDQDTIDKFNRTFNKKDEVINSSQTLKDDLQNLKIENPADVITLPLALIGTAWNLVSYVIDNFTLLDSAIEGISAFTGIPTWVSTFILLIVILFFVFSILSVIFGKDI